MILYLISVNIHVLSLWKVNARLYEQDNCHFIKTHLANPYKADTFLNYVQFL